MPQTREIVGRRDPYAANVKPIDGSNAAGKVPGTREVVRDQASTDRRAERSAGRDGEALTEGFGGGVRNSEVYRR